MEGREAEREEMGGGEERYTNSDLISLQNVNINGMVFDMVDGVAV